MRSYRAKFINRHVYWHATCILQRILSRTFANGASESKCTCVLQEAMRAGIDSFRVTSTAVLETCQLRSRAESKRAQFLDLSLALFANRPITFSRVKPFLLCFRKFRNVSSNVISGDFACDCGEEYATIKRANARVPTRFRFFRISLQEQRSIFCMQLNLWRLYLTTDNRKHVHYHID